MVTNMTCIYYIKLYIFNEHGFDLKTIHICYNKFLLGIGLGFTKLLSGCIDMVESESTKDILLSQIRLIKDNNKAIFTNS